MLGIVVKWDFVNKKSLYQRVLHYGDENDYFCECSCNINPVFLCSAYGTNVDTVICTVYECVYTCVCICVCVSRVCVYSVKQAWSQPSLMWSSVSIPYQQHFVVPASLSVLCVCTTFLPDSQQPPKYTCTLSHCRCFPLLANPSHPCFRSDHSHGFWCYLHAFLNIFLGDLMYVITYQKWN